MKKPIEISLFVVIAAYIACVAFSASAQVLWKYTDKDGKITYSDKAPIDGVKAERVNTDTAGKVVPASKNQLSGIPQSSATVSSRASAREALRDSYRQNVDEAREELDKAQKALETGREPTEEERQIVVGRGKDGKPTGVNAMNRKPEYYARIAELEAAIKKAEANVAAAERNFAENAPK